MFVLVFGLFLGVLWGFVLCRTLRRVYNDVIIEISLTIGCSYLCFWTAEMLLMFHFLRPDVFSLGDIGLIRGTQRLVPDAETKEQVGEIAERWRPYRTAAAWYLWRILDPVPVEY